jgi:DNA-directed RNA polymerase subunit M/transcription elongation factor TFIIS
MANDLFGGLGGLGGALGGLMGGLAKSGLVPKDTTEGRLLTTQSELSDLKKQETELLTEIGRKAYEQNPSAWAQDAKLRLIRQNILSAESALNEAKQAQEQADAAKAAEEARGRCPNCGHKNPEGVRFCQECGASLAAAEARNCSSCGAELSPGTRFCGACGARQEG